MKKRKTEDLLKKAQWNNNPQSRSVSSNQYVRNTIITELAKRRANGFCQLCDSEAPFKNKSGEPYLETHHIIW